MRKRNLVVLFIIILGLAFWAFRTSGQNAPSYIQSMAAMQATTGSIGGGALLAGSCASGTVAVTASLTGNAVLVSPNTYPGDGIVWFGYVSSNGTVTVKVCAILALTPSAGTYNVKVIQ
jgi:hypothetical protein